MNRKQTLAAFCLAVTLLSQSGCCCCVSIPTGPEGGEFGDFAPPEGFGEEGEDSLEDVETEEEFDGDE
ncbi:MAG TPA: hypothetical protein VGN57_16685 [Pirellulaceae bacterium]|jgi:hypothetical protein|nr:hypothetical protein [Pirellulaceae bacterium]